MNDDFDYIIIGAGSAGCVLANRLSENPSHRVLLVESGPPDKSPLIDMPRGIGQLLQPGNPHVWSYEVSKGGNRGTETWLKGKTLGGSSSVNGMVYVRGHPADYDGWSALGCEGWSWADVAKVFRTLEGHELGPAPDRGGDGLLKISVQPRVGDLTEAVLNAAEQAGTPRVADVNLAYEGGFGYQPRTTWGGLRQSAAKAFLRPALSRANLMVLTGATAARLTVEGGRAVGVELRGAEGRRVRARREIILAAGSLASPKLLQLSGLGPGRLLRSLGVEVIVDLPEVGQNLQEHYYLQVQFRVTHGSLNREFAGLRLLGSMAKYVAFHRGPMTHAAHELCGFVKTRPGLERPDVQLGVGLYTMTPTAKGLAIDSAPGITIGGYVMQPKSRGVFNIVSPDPDAAPAIDANYLASEADRAGSVAMVRYIRKIAMQPALQPFIVSEISPGQDVQTDEDIVEAHRALGSTAFHVSGTCRMGSDERAVVDSKLRVRGVGGLRIADTSILPRLISGNTNAVAMMIGARAADFILCP